MLCWLNHPYKSNRTTRDNATLQEKFTSRCTKTTTCCSRHGTVIYNSTLCVRSTVWAVLWYQMPNASVYMPSPSSAYRPARLGWTGFRCRKWNHNFKCKQPRVVHSVAGGTRLRGRIISIVDGLWFEGFEVFTFNPWRGPRTEIGHRCPVYVPGERGSEGDGRV